MIMRNGAAGLFAYLLLRIEVRGSDGGIDNFQARVCRQSLSNRLATVPGRAIPKQDNWYIWESAQNQLEMGCALFGIQLLAARDQFTASAQVKCAVETGFGSSGVNPHYGCIANGRPDSHRGGLQVHPGFILTQKNRFGHILRYINHFFSA